MYDPLVDHKLNNNQGFPNSYWSSTTTSINYEALTTNINADVVIIGAGYTGLSCAIHLAEQGVSNIVVIEANDVGWGCSGRNAGFVLPGSGRLGYKQLVDRFGIEQAHLLHDDFMSAIKLIDTLSLKAKVKIDKTELGYLKLAHSKKWFEKLKISADYLHNEFNYDVEVISKSDFCHDYVNHQHVFGAIRYNNGFGINPLKLINSYAEYATSLGVTIYNQSPVIDIQEKGQTCKQQQIITTESGQIFADKLVIATNAYTPKMLNTPLKHKVLPVLSNVIVTRVLTSEELKRSNFKTHQVMMDTRELKYYYRLLPDNRILFGGRGAISGKEANNPKYAHRLLAQLHSSFPELSNVTIDYNWIGWISVPFDQMPHIHRTDNDMFYATGYCGSGVSFSAYAGKLLAELIQEKDVNSPLLSQLPSFPLSQFRRTGQRFFYQYGRVKDWLS
jgi:glycine/D-amino acid oxidase-like deaminating enzyme